MKTKSFFIIVAAILFAAGATAQPVSGPKIVAGIAPSYDVNGMNIGVNVTGVNPVTNHPNMNFRLEFNLHNLVTKVGFSSIGSSYFGISVYSDIGLEAFTGLGLYIDPAATLLLGPSMDIGCGYEFHKFYCGIVGQLCPCSPTKEVISLRLSYVIPISRNR